MKLPLLILLTCTMSFYAQALSGQTVSYAEGLEKCELIRKKKLESNPKGFVFVRPTCMEGAMIPEFDAITLNGQKVSRDSLLGQVTVLNFWFIACQPCIAEIPGLQALKEKYAAQNVNFIAISRDDENSVEEFLHVHNWDFDHIASEELNNDVFRIKWGYPTTFVLDKKGQIIYATSGGKPDGSAVEEIQRELIPVIDAAIE